jgi:predicted ribosome quality control (RQC) complex YloA/Tae2 family protein
MEIQIANLTLKHLVEENQFLVNGFINKAQTTEDNLLKLKIHTKIGDKNVVITKNCFFVSNQLEQAKQNPGGFSALLKKYLFNQRIISLEQKGLDRIVTIKFPNNYLILELFAKGNIILCNENLNIIKAMRKETWKDRELSKSQKYIYPSSRGLNPLTNSYEEFYSKLKENEKTFFGATLDILNLAPTILEYIFETLNLDKKKNAKDMLEKESKKLFNKIFEIYSQEKNEVFLYENTLYSINIGKKIEKNYNNINKALNDIIERKIENKEEKKKEVKKIDYKQQQKDFEKEEILMKEKAEQIYLNYNELDEIIKKIKDKKSDNFLIKKMIGLSNERLTIKEIDLKKEKLIVEIKNN